MYQVLSPDGFPIERDAEFNTLDDANKALRRFVNRFTSQGYYSTSSREHIALTDIADYCEIVKL